jgi:hypothetical protein
MFFRFLFQDPVYSLMQRRDAGARGTIRGAFIILIIDENRAAARSCASFYISPAIADQVTPSSIEIVLGGCLEEKTRQWFAAVTTVCIVVVTNEEAIQWKIGPQKFMDFHYLLLTRCTSPDIRLVSHYQEQESMFFESRE